MWDKRPPIRPILYSSTHPVVVRPRHAGASLKVDPLAQSELGRAYRDGRSLKLYVVSGLEVVVRPNGFDKR